MAETIACAISGILCLNLLTGSNPAPIGINISKGTGHTNKYYGMVKQSLVCCPDLRALHSHSIKPSSMGPVPLGTGQT